jgi:hypothetical protein
MVGQRAYHGKSTASAEAKDPGERGGGMLWVILMVKPIRAFVKRLRCATMALSFSYIFDRLEGITASVIHVFTPETGRIHRWQNRRKHLLLWQIWMGGLSFDRLTVHELCDLRR